MRRCFTRPKLQFLTGLGFGLLVSVVFFQSGFVYRHHLAILRPSVIENHVTGLERAPHVHQMIRTDDTHVHQDDSKVADDLAKKVRVLCWVMTAPANFRTKADAVKHTWGRRCNILLFYSSVYDEHLQTTVVNVTEKHGNLTAKTMIAFQHVYDNYYDQADWFMKSDDDTYVIVENLRYFLSTKNTSEPLYFGQHFNAWVNQGYFSGGAGYVLSKEALRRFGKRNSTLCSSSGRSEDVDLGRCMEKLGVKTGNSTDLQGRSRFHCFAPEAHLNGLYPEWYINYTVGGAKQGIDSINDYAVSFHYISPKDMDKLEFYVYHLRPFGIKGSED